MDDEIPVQNMAPYLPWCLLFLGLYQAMDLEDDEIPVQNMAPYLPWCLLFLVVMIIKNDKRY